MKPATNPRRFTLKFSPTSDLVFVLVISLAGSRGALMTRLGGLPSDEPSAIPATRTVPGFASELEALE
jgi:hypothetical protein